MTTTINWGILSPGRIAHQFAQAIEVVNDANIVAVASATPGKATDFAAKYNIPHAYRDYQELIASQQVDIVYVASVHTMHAHQTMRCLLAGIPVLCEKPITVNTQQLSELIKTAEKQKVFLMEALWTRFLPITEAVQKWLADEEIGELERIKSSFGFIANTSNKDRLKNPELAGGVLLDLGVYPIAMSQLFAQADVTDIRTNASISETGIDEQLDVVLKYANGKTSEFSCSFRHHYKNAMTLEGSAGYIEIKEQFWGATKAVLHTDNQAQEIELPHAANGFEYQILAAMSALHNKQLETAQMPLADSLKNMQVMDQIRDQIGLRYPFEQEK